MNGFAVLVVALSLAQPEPSPAPAVEEAPAREGSPPPAAAPSPTPAPTSPSARASAPASPPAPAPAPASPRTPAAPAAAPLAPSLSRGDPPAAAPASPRPRPAPAPQEPERVQVARAALAFLDALVAGDTAALAAASTERFSFDGDVRQGRDQVRRRWSEVLAARSAPRDAVNDLEVLPAADALARLGPPPARVAPLAARGAWVALADVSGRPVVLFLTRDGARFAVAGMHD